MKWYEYIPDGDLQQINKFLDNLMGQSLDFDHGQREEVIKDLFGLINMSLEQKKSIISAYKSLSCDEIHKIFAEELLPKEEVYITNIFCHKAEAAAVSEFLNRQIDWLFVLEVANSREVITKFCSAHEELVNNDNLRYFLDLLVDNDCADGFLAAFHHFTKEFYYNDDLYERDVLSEYIANYYSIISKTCLEDLNSISPRRFSVKGMAIKDTANACQVLLENLCIEGINKRFIEVCFRYYRKEHAAKNMSKIKAALAIHCLYKTKDINKYQQRMADIFIGSYNNVVVDCTAKNIIQCFDHYIKVHPFLGKEEQKYILGKLEFLLNHSIKNQREKQKLFLKLKRMVCSQDKILTEIPAITLLLPFMPETYFQIIEIDDEKADSFNPSRKTHIVLKALAGEENSVLEPLIQEYVSNESSSQKDIYNLYLVIWGLNQQLAKHLLQCYKQKTANTFELEDCIKLTMNNIEDGISICLS